MDKLNNYFDKAKELKLDKELIDIQNFDSIIKKKSIKQNLIKGTVVMSIFKGAVVMSILTLIILGITLLLPNEKENQKDFNPETMRRLPIFHLTIEELAELGIHNFPKTYEEYEKTNNNETFISPDSIFSPLYMYFSFKESRFLRNSINGNIRSSFGNENHSDDIIQRRSYVNSKIQNIQNLLNNEEITFIKNKYFLYEKTNFKGIENLVPISITDDYGYITEFYIWFIPSQKLYDKLPERYKKTFSEFYTISDELIVDEFDFKKFISNEKEKNKNKANELVETIDLTLSEVEELGIKIENKNVKIIFGATGEKSNDVKYQLYSFNSEGENNSQKIDYEVNEDLIPEMLYIYRYDKSEDDIQYNGSIMFNVLNKHNLLQLNTFENVDIEKSKLKVNYIKNKEIASIINQVVPIKFKITYNNNKFNEFVVWFRLSDKLINKLPERYRIRFIKEFVLIEQVLNEEKELKDLCDELNQESLLGLCVAESIKNVKVYPNPTNKIVNITLDIDEDKELKLLIYDTAGREIKSELKKFVKGENKVEIEVSHIKSGIYIINILDHKELLFARNIIIE